MSSWRLVDGCNCTTIVSRGGVRVRKSVVTGGASVPVIKFAIESDREQPIAIRMYETIPDGFDPAAIDFDVEHAEGRWHTIGYQLEFSVTLAPGDSLVAAFTIDGTEHDARQFVGVPLIETVQPTDPEVLTNDDGVPTWRGGAGAVQASGRAGIIQDDGGSTVTGDSNFENGTKASPECLAVIPAYNEEHSIGEVIEQSEEHVDCVLVIDDGSEDDTALEARDAGADVVQHERNKGYGAALRTAFEEADRRGADHLVVLDGDGQHDPADISRLVNRQRATGAEVVIGSRFTGDRESDIPLYRRFGLWVVNFMTNLSMGTLTPASGIRDTQSGFRAYDRRAIRSLAVDDTIGDHMHASTNILYHARRHDYDVEEVGTRVEYDVEDSSSHSPLSHGLVLVSNILQVIERERPIASLGIPGFLSAFVGLGFFYWAISNYVQSGVFSVGLTMVAVFFALIGVFACFTAIMLHALNQFTVPRQ